MTLTLQILAAGALVLIDLRIALWLWSAWCDHRAERQANDLVPRLIRAHQIIRDMTGQLRELQTLAARVRQSLWGNDGTN